MTTRRNARTANSRSRGRDADRDPTRGPQGGQWGQVLNPVFTHSALLVPRQGQEDIELVTFSPAAQIRQSASTRKRLELHRPTKNPTNVLQRIGFDDLRELHVFPGPVSRKGIFASFDHLGMAATFSETDKDMDDVRNELEDQYEFVKDFPLSIPSRVIMRDVPMNKARQALDRREWPEASGVAEAHRGGVRGAGTLVGVLDTGVDADHEEFSDHRINYRYVSLQPNSPYWPPRDVRGFDTDGHGTHVCGVIAGRSIGVAPEAQLYVASVIESETILTSLTRVASGLNWLFRQFTRPDNEHLPAVVSMSLGFPETLPGVSDADYQGRLRAMRTLLRTLLQANVLPVVAIGNDGQGKYGYPGAFNDVVGVGAVDFEGKVASFSGSGNPAGEGVTKPDLMGYGVGVNSSLERDYSGKSVYQRLNGTSMATPYVSGVATLYRSLYPALTVDEIKDMLFQTALPLSGQPAARTGKGLARFDDGQGVRRSSSRGRVNAKKGAAKKKATAARKQGRGR